MSLMRTHIAGKGCNQDFDASPGEKLLFAGLRSGVPLPYECATGTCGSCRAKLKSGQIDDGWLHAPGRKNFKAGRNELLMCQAVAKSACRLAVSSDLQPFREDDFHPTHHRGTISLCARLTDEVLRFDVKLPAPVGFHAGQFFVLRAPAGSGVDGYRAYSMVNYSPQTDRLEFIIKRKPDGAFSDWMFNADQTNAPLELFGPLGRATFHADEHCDLFLIAGGSGVAGLLSILEHASILDYWRNHKIALFFGVRTWSDVIFPERLTALRERFADSLAVHIVASEVDPEIPPPATLSSLSTARGLVHETAVKALSPDARKTMVFVAGPQPMVDASLRSLLLESKIPAQLIRYDKFS